MDVSANITGIKYTPFLGRKLNHYKITSLSEALLKEASFILQIDKQSQIAVSWWVSPKRTRSYPYARVYDTLSFQGKRATIIPLVKDEGKQGDRDFLQWDTISLMNLLGIYTIISYYSNAERSSRYRHKITNQRFAPEHLKEEIVNLLSYQSDALHWNLEQIGKIGNIGQKVLDSYAEISKRHRVEMHSFKSAAKRIQELQMGRENFMNLSRELAKKAQNRESVTVQPKEMLLGLKARLTIKNYLGGYYYFTCDEVKIENKNIYLIEGKHSADNIIPSLEDIKDGLVKMILFTNLKDVKVGDEEYYPIAILKLTSNREFSMEELSESQKKLLAILKTEAIENNFQVMINNIDLKEIKL